MPIEGILPVVPTPFLDGEFDEASFQRLLDHMLPFVDGYTLLGSTGEAPSLTGEQRRRIAARALEMTPDDATVVVGVSDTSAAESAALGRHAQEHGAAAVLCAAPYYYANTPAGVRSYLEQVDAALEIDLVLYDNPLIGGTVLDADDVLEWAGELERLTAVKLTSHDTAKIATWQAAGLQVLAGDDVIAFRYLAGGVDGAMVIAPALFPEAFSEGWSLLRDGRPVESLELFGRRILPVLHVFGVGDEILTTKALLKEMGVFSSDEMLAPLSQIGEDRRQLLREAYEACQGPLAKAVAGVG